MRLALCISLLPQLFLHVPLQKSYLRLYLQFAHVIRLRAPCIIRLFKWLNNGIGMLKKTNVRWLMARAESRKKCTRSFLSK